MEMGESPEFQAKVDSLYDEAFVQKYVLTHLVDSCNKYFAAAANYVDNGKNSSTICTVYQICFMGP